MFDVESQGSKTSWSVGRLPSLSPLCTGVDRGGGDSPGSSGVHGSQRPTAYSTELPTRGVGWGTVRSSEWTASVVEDRTESPHRKNH